MSSPTDLLRLRAEKAARRARMAPYIGFGLIGVAIAFTGLFFYQAGVFGALIPKPPQPVPKIEKADQITSQQSHVTGFDREQQPYELEARQGFQDKDKPNLVHLEELTGTFRKRSGKSYNIAANNGLYDTKVKEIALSGDVKIVEPGRLTASMAKALVQVDSKSLDTDVPVEVVMNDGSGQINAGGMKISDDGKTILFLNGVKARFEGDGKGDQR